jgi:hypothetical protein
MHTPGPWLYGRISDEVEAIVTPDGDSIFDVRNASPADLSLLSAAPDLLAALQHVLERATMPGFLRDEVKAAIARATA